MARTGLRFAIEPPAAQRRGQRLPRRMFLPRRHADPERADDLAEVAIRHQVIVFNCDPTQTERIVDTDPTAGVLGLPKADTARPGSGVRCFRGRTNRMPANVCASGLNWERCGHRSATASAWEDSR
jgi:hypothetical protein